MKDFIFSYLLSYFYFFIMFYYEAGRFFPTDSVTPRWGKNVCTTGKFFIGITLSYCYLWNLWNEYLCVSFFQATSKSTFSSLDCCSI